MNATENHGQYPLFYTARMMVRRMSFRYTFKQRQWFAKWDICRNQKYFLNKCKDLLNKIALQQIR